MQTALVQDEALKRANARIEELQAQLGAGEQEQRPGGFLDSMREAVLGPREPRGSVPTVRSPATQTSPMAPPPYPPQAGYPGQMPTGAAFGSGGSFLGTAASTAAGVIGGALLMGGIRSMFGQHSGSSGTTHSAFGSLDDDRAPIRSGSAADSDIAREAGIKTSGTARRIAKPTLIWLTRPMSGIRLKTSATMTAVPAATIATLPERQTKPMRRPAGVSSTAHRER